MGSSGRSSCLLETHKPMKPAPKIVPVKPKFLMELPFFYKPTFWQRVKILCGFNLRYDVTIQMPHNPGPDTMAKCKTVLTDQLPPEPLV